MSLMVVGRVAVLLAVFGVLFLSLSTGCNMLSVDKAYGSDNRTISANTQVIILNGDVGGDVKVETWGKDYVEVLWTKSTTWGASELAKVEVKITETPATDTPGQLSIESKVSGHNVRVSLTYDIKLPKDALLARVESGSGDIVLHGTGGNTIISSKNGNISVKNASGYLDATAGRGAIRLEGTTGGAKLTTTESPVKVINADGPITATTSNGQIEITNCKGDVTLRTSRGGISVSNLQGCVLLAKTTNGSIDISRATAIEVAETSNGDVSAGINTVGDNGTIIRVTRGSISLYLASDINAEIELKTLSGDVAIHSAGKISLTGDFSAQYFKGIIGAGGNKIYAETSKGRIDVYGSDVTP